MSDAVYGPRTNEIRDFISRLPDVSKETWQQAVDAIPDNWDLVCFEVFEIASENGLVREWNELRHELRDVVDDRRLVGSFATWAMMLQDVISEKQYDTLTCPVVAAGILDERKGVEDE